MDKEKQCQIVETTFVENEKTTAVAAKAPEGKVKKFVKRTWKYAVVGLLSAVGGYAIGRHSHGGSSDEFGTTDYDQAYDEGQETPEE